MENLSKRELNKQISVLFKEYPKEKMGINPYYFNDIEKKTTEYLLEFQSRYHNREAIGHVNKLNQRDKELYKEKKKIKFIIETYSTNIQSGEFPKSIQIGFSGQKEIISTTSSHVITSVLRSLELYSNDLFKIMPEFEKSNPRKVETKIFEIWLNGLYSHLFLESESNCFTTVGTLIEILTKVNITKKQLELIQTLCSFINIDYYDIQSLREFLYKFYPPKQK